MFKFKGKTKSFSEIKGQDTLWYTFKEGQMVKAELSELVLSQGGELTIVKDEVKEVKVEKKQVKKTIKKAIKKVAKKVNKK